MHTHTWAHLQVEQLAANVTQQQNALQLQLEEVAQRWRRAPQRFEGSMVPVSSYVPGDTVVFNFVGNFSQAFLSLNAATVMVQVWGAQGGAAAVNERNGPGALGGYARGTLAVTHESYRVFVGGQGQSGGSWRAGGGGGGGATDVRPGNVSFQSDSADALSARLIVAGGGGGSCGQAPLGGLGVGGGARGGTADNGPPSGANSTHGGIGWNNVAGMVRGLFGSAGGQCGHPLLPISAAGGWNGGGCGGGPGSSCIAGGGGGWYGGGPGDYLGVRGGGGGSGYLSSQLLDGTMLSGVRAGHGLAVIEILTTI
jgi:trimeric autotransporter adhesin